MLSLALPVVLTYLGLMIMGVVDLLCVGRVSSTAIGAVGVGTSIFNWVMVFGIGLLTGLDFMIAHAHGASEPEKSHFAWAQGIWISVLMGLPMTLAMYWGADSLGWIGTNPEIIPECREYLQIISFSLIPVFLFNACRQYLQAVEIARPAMWILLIANLVNAAANYAWVLGHWGFPALGTRGSAWATLSARWLMAFLMAGYLVYWDFKNQKLIAKLGTRIHRETFQRLVALGTPAAFQMTLEVGVFALSTTLAARLSADALAAHQIVLNIASTTFMVPLGIGSATSVLVGQELGRKRPLEARQMGWKGFRLSWIFMATSCAALLLFAGPILRFYTIEPGVIEIGKRILFLAALFQLFDGTQVVATGALRGLADTRTSMIANLIGHWIIGLPLGVFLCFWNGSGVVGLWVGLTLGLTVVAILLTWRWIALTSASRILRLS